MLDLLGATVALAVIIAIPCFLGSNALARVEAHPERVSRIYLRADFDLDVYWLHVQMKNGTKRLIAPPWEIEGALQRLQAAGLRLSADDQATLDLLLARKRGETDPAATPSPVLVRQNTGKNAHA